jgi:hypothetical protein
VAELLRQLNIPKADLFGFSNGGQTALEDVVRPEHAVEMYRLLPHGRLAILGGSHGSYLGEAMSADPNSKVPELFVAMLDEYLAAPVTENS